MESVGRQVQSTVNNIPRGLAIRGIVAIAFGVLVLVQPNISLSALVFLVGAFATVDGVLSLVLAFGFVPSGSRVWLIINGIAGIAVGVITFTSPDISELALLYVVGAWAIVLGGIQFVAAFSAPVETRYRVLLFVYSVISVVFGVIMFLAPGTGALGLLALIAAYAIVTGVTLIGAAIDFRSTSQDVKDQVGSTLAHGNS